MPQSIRKHFQPVSKQQFFNNQKNIEIKAPGGSAGELAERLLEIGAAKTSDDATVAVARLHPEDLLT